MDQNAKEEWIQQWETMEDNTPQLIPSEGWSLWHNDFKFSNLGQKSFDMIIQQNYSTQYWHQEDKLGDIYDSINWEACGEFFHLLSPIQRAFAAKWMTGWLPVAKICVSGNLGKQICVPVVIYIRKWCHTCTLALKQV